MGGRLADAGHAGRSRGVERAREHAERRVEASRTWCEPGHGRIEGGAQRAAARPRRAGRPRGRSTSRRRTGGRAPRAARPGPRRPRPRGRAAARRARWRWRPLRPSRRRRTTGTPCSSRRRTSRATAGASRISSASGAGARERQRAEGDDGLAGHAERRRARGQQAETGGGPQQRHGDRGRVLPGLLAAVEHDQRLASRNQLHGPVQRIAALDGGCPECGRQRGGHAVAARRGQVHDDHPVGEAVGDARGRVHGQGGLPHAAGAHDADDPVALETGGDGGALVVAADERGQRRRAAAWRGLPPGRVERRVLEQDGGLEPAELVAGLEAGAVGQERGGLPVGPQRVRLPAGTRERGHQQRPPPLAQRLVVDEAAEQGQRPGRGRRPRSARRRGRPRRPGARRRAWLPGPPGRGPRRGGPTAPVPATGTARCRGRRRRRRAGRRRGRRPPGRRGHGPRRGRSPPRSRRRARRGAGRSRRGRSRCGPGRRRAGAAVAATRVPGARCGPWAVRPRATGARRARRPTSPGRGAAPAGRADGPRGRAGSCSCRRPPTRRGVRGAPRPSFPPRRQRSCAGNDQ